MGKKWYYLVKYEKGLKTGEPYKISGAEGGNRTPMGLLPPDFESGASTNSTTSAYIGQ